MVVSRPLETPNQMRNKAQVAFAILFVCVLLAMGFCLDRVAGASGAEQDPRYVLPAEGDNSKQAFTRPRYDLALAFTVPGMVTSLPVEPGDRVKKGQMLIKLEDKEGEAQVEILELQNASNVSVEAAQAELAMADWELEKIEGMDNASSPTELKRAGIQKRIRKLQVEQAQLDKSLIEHQLKRAQATHDRYTLLAPLDGVVERVAVEEGETVEQFKPVLMLVVTDPLWIDVGVPVRETLNLKAGAPAWVRLQLPDHYDKPVEGKIIHMDQVADAGSQRRLVRVEMANPQQFPAGIEVTVSFEEPKGLAEADPQRK